jgi:hypothetical protein
MVSTILKACGALLLPALLLAGQNACRMDSRLDALSGPVTVGDVWLELRPRPPLRAEKDLQRVALELEPPFRDDFYGEGGGAARGKGILMPDGEVINPEVEVIDGAGGSHRLVYAGARSGGEVVVYDLPHPEEWPRDRAFETVRIRSTRPFKCKAVYWLDESSKDWH